jgi:hypothetical protein
MISVTFPGMAMLLLPVIAIEAVVLRSRLSLPLTKAFGVSGVANAASMIVGMPATWLVLTLCEMGFMAAADALVSSPRSHVSVMERIVSVIVTAPWLPPPEGGLWRVPLAVLILLVPFFLVSLWVEALVAKRMLPDLSIESEVRSWRKGKLFNGVKIANLLSYGLMFILTSFWLIASIHHSRHPVNRRVVGEYLPPRDTGRR